MERNQWTESKIAILTELYPVETTDYTASVLGMSKTAVKNKARKLGLVKYAKSVWMERAEHIRNHFHDRSFSEMGEDLGITKMSVGRIAKQIGLQRTKQEIHQVSSRIHQKLIKRERSRVLFGLEPVTRIKVVTNRAKIRLRSQLKTIGYTISKERNILYYSDDTDRKARLEKHGERLGLQFRPVPESLLTAIL